jgi:excisionase family DNA binding protein
MCAAVRAGMPLLFGGQPSRAVFRTIAKVFTNVKDREIVCFVRSKTYTTQQAADAVKITRQTLQAWIAKGKVKAPETQLRNGRGVRLWTVSDVALLRKVKSKIYLKEMGRPSKNRMK